MYGEYRSIVTTDCIHYLNLRIRQSTAFFILDARHTIHSRRRLSRSVHGFLTPFAG